MTEETSALLSALHDLDGAIIGVMIGLLTDSLPPQEQAEFGELLTTAAKLVHQHPNTTAPDIAEWHRPTTESPDR